ncbi:MAG: SDR family oxidoreductase [Acidimicrobiia bacterium]|nr:SDR family oxidoreductase [Acidimicrobiia bacterium]
MTGSGAPAAGQPVVVVTGGGGGIGAAIATELGRKGAFVVTMDPLVSLDGTEQLPAPAETTAGRIIAAGGAARASGVSVTDGAAVRDLFENLDRLDAVVNVAGITRPTSFAKGTEQDWRGVLEVHLKGYLNILTAALPIMAEARYGRVLGVTSGSGWRPADTGAYGCAKRAVASLTWQMGNEAPPGVTVNAVSPIALTRMVTAALGRARSAGGGGGGTSATGGLSLGSMPAPEDLGPLGAYLVGADVGWCNGRVLFAGGSEVALIDEPQLLEVIRSDDVRSLPHLFEAAAAAVLAPAEATQLTNGGSNPRLATIFDDPGAVEGRAGKVGSCFIVGESPGVAAAVTAALAARGVTCAAVAAAPASGFAGAAEALAATVSRVGAPDAVVVALDGTPGAPGGASGWERLLAEHAEVVDHIHRDAGWVRAVADYAAAADRPLRLVTLTDATTAGGRSRAQSSAQLARSSRRATGERVAAFAVSMEALGDDALGPIGELTAHLLCSPAGIDLAGAELVTGAGWCGLRSHPHPSGSIVFGGPELPEWFDATLRALVGR